MASHDGTKNVFFLEKKVCLGVTNGWQRNLEGDPLDKNNVISTHLRPDQFFVEWTAGQGAFSTSWRPLVATGSLAAPGGPDPGGPDRGGPWRPLAATGGPWRSLAAPGRPSCGNSPGPPV